MRAILSLVLFGLISSTAFANRVGLSAIRKSHETHIQAYLRHGVVTPNVSRQPQKVSKDLRDLDIKVIPDVGSMNDLINQFEFVRDLRFMQGQEKNFLRRMTWLYPDDGCFARAEMAAYLLVDNKFVKPKKIFVFGNLSAKTSNTRSGKVEWWYHVAVTYRVGETAYVFDPSLDPKRPMTLADWNTGVGGLKNRVTYAICNYATFDPNDSCEKAGEIDSSEALYQEKLFLSREWSRLLELNRIPEKELGDFPPWKN